MKDFTRPRPGAVIESDGIHFAVWAPGKRSVEVVLEKSGDTVSMQPTQGGFFEAYVEALATGARYRIRLDGRQMFPDPASRFQPEGVHGPSVVVDPNSFAWSDDTWQGIAPDQRIIYELHVGTFTPEGTFDAARELLPYLRDLGINTVELMPVADFPGRWNWGYDHAALYAPSHNYGSPDDLRRFVDDAHRHGIAVVLDVIYNHFGPDGAYAAAFGNFFTSKHDTPWGMAINLDDKHSEGVRHFFIDNAVHWLTEYHIDGLRLDATHALIDDSPKHFLIELAEKVHGLKQGPPRFLIAEDHRNLNTLLHPRAEGGYGLDGVWADDFHHVIRNRTAGDTESYYADFRDSTTEQIARTINRGWLYEGQRSPSLKRPRGTDPSGIPPEKFVFFIQNHDQVGNRPLGNRLTDDIPLPLYRAISSLLLFVPETPLLFMGQEWAATSPFLFFTDHNQELGRAVTRGRRNEFRDFAGFKGQVPDPQNPQTFERSRLNWEEADSELHRGVLQLYRDLLERRRDLARPVRAAALTDAVVEIRRGDLALLVAFDAGDVPAPDEAEIVWHSEDPRYAGDESRPPALDGSSVSFARPSALLLHDRSAA